jgi:hypothetical protein
MALAPRCKWSISVFPTPAYPVPPVAMDETEMLESQLKFLEWQLEQIRTRLEELKR